MGDDLGLHAGDDSPWGADVPVPSHRPIEWDRRASSTGPESPVPNGPETSGRSDPTLDPNAVSEPFDTGPPDGTTMDEPTTNRTKLFVGIAVLGVLALGAASLAAGRDGSGSDATPATTEAAVADTAAPVATDVLDTIAPDSLPADTSTSQSDPAVDGRLPAPEPQARDDPPEWVAGSFEVPDILSDATVTTTIVVVTRDGILRELDLPSGAMREIEIGPVFGFNQFRIGRSSTLVGSDTTLQNVPSAVLYRPGLAPVDLGPDSVSANFIARPGTDQYVGYLFGVGPEDYRDLTVAADGTVDQTAESVEDGRVPWQRRFTPDGNEIFAEGGSFFEVLPDESVALLTRGEILSFSSHHLLVRECDDAFACAEWLVDGATRERSPVVVGPDFVDGLVGSTQVSPDGSKLWFVAFDDGGTEFIMDLATGATIEIGASGRSGRGGQLPVETFVWTADSAGIIRSAVTGLEFVDAETGGTTPVAAELPSPVLAGTRLDLAGVPAAELDVAGAGSGVTGLQIAGYGEDVVGRGVVHRIDIDSGEIVSVAVDRIGSSAPVFVMTDQTGVSVVAYDNVDGVRVDDQAWSPLSGESFGGLMLPGPRPDTLWVPRQNDDVGRNVGFELVDSFGNPVGETIVVPAGPVDATGSDGAGGVLATSPIGGSYAVDPTGIERLTTGDLLALGPTTAIAEECDVALVCGLVALDRATGERTPIEPDIATAMVGVPPPLGALSGRTVSPTGDAALLYDEMSSGFRFVDLSTGASVSAPTVDLSGNLVWNADGSVAVFLADGVVSLYDRNTNSLRPLAQLPRLRSFAELMPVGPAGLVTGPSPVLR